MVGATRQAAPKHRRLVRLSVGALLAVLTGAAEQDLVVLNLHAEPFRRTLDRPLKARIIEGHEPPALLADKVVMVMLAPRV